MKKLRVGLALCLILLSPSLLANEEALSYISNIGTQANLQDLERVRQTLVTPPFLPKHQQQYSGKPRIIDMEMVIEGENPVIKINEILADML